MTIHYDSVLLWGLVATAAQATLEAGAQGLGLSRMSLPFMLGTVFTGKRDTASVVGFVSHLVNGWIFAFGYAAIFESVGLATWWLGMILGAVHALFMLVVVMPLMPSIHPRMASEHSGPDVTRSLEPPGFLALHYGRWTPIMVVVAHVAFGLILGSFYGPT